MFSIIFIHFVFSSDLSSTFLIFFLRPAYCWMAFLLAKCVLYFNYISIGECKLTEIKEKSLRRAARYEGKAIESKKKLVKECMKERERNWGNGQEGERARKRKKGLEEVRNGGTQMEARKDDSKPSYRRKKKERSRREEDKDKGIQI